MATEKCLHSLWLLQLKYLKRNERLNHLQQIAATCFNWLQFTKQDINNIFGTFQFKLLSFSHHPENFPKLCFMLHIAFMIYQNIGPTIAAFCLVKIPLIHQSSRIPMRQIFLDNNLHLHASTFNFSDSRFLIGYLFSSAHHCNQWG